MRRELVAKLCCGKNHSLIRKIDQYIYILMPVNHLFNGEKEKTWRLVLLITIQVEWYCKTSVSPHIYHTRVIIMVYT